MKTLRFVYGIRLNEQHSIHFSDDVFRFTHTKISLSKKTVHNSSVVDGMERDSELSFALPFAVIAYVHKSRAKPSFLLRQNERVCHRIAFSKTKYHGKTVVSCFGGEREIRTLAPVSRPTPLAGAPLHLLEYFSVAAQIV